MWGEGDVQTFLPYPSFQESAEVLDRQRLGKQRVEALTIVRILVDGMMGWANHPAVRMWRNYEEALVIYGLAICEEWVSRGYRDMLQDQFLKYYDIVEDHYSPEVLMPWWLGIDAFHRSHRAALLAKEPKWYSKFGWEEEPAIDYWWPTDHDPYDWAPLEDWEEEVARKLEGAN